MEDNNLNSDDAKKIEAIRRQAALRKKIQSHTEDVKDKAVMDGSRYPFNYRITALIAASLLFAGAFLPFASIPGRGDTPYLFLSGAAGPAMMILLAVYFVLTLLKINRFHAYIGVFALGFGLFSVMNVMKIKLHVEQVQTVQSLSHNETMKRYKKSQDHRQDVMRSMGMSDEMIEEQLGSQQQPVANNIADVEFRYGLAVMILGGIIVLVNGVMVFYKARRNREEQFRSKNNLGTN